MKSYDDYFDLRAPIELLLRHRAFILLATGAAILAALVVTLLLPRVYGAEATIAMSPSRTEVQFDPRIQTLADYELAGGTIQARREALTALIRSNEVVQGVLADVHDNLQADQRSVRWLRESIVVQTAGDLINLEVRHEDPETAALVANAWSEQYEQHVNRVYSSRPNVIGSQIEQQVNEARDGYQSTQEALELFISADPAEALQRELDAKLAVLDNYQQASVVSQVRPVDRNQFVLDAYFQELEQIDQLLGDAQALREQVANDTGSEAANMGNSLALITLRSRAFAGDHRYIDTEGTVSVVRPGPNFQIEVASIPASAVTTADVDSLIATLETRRELAQGRIDSFLEGIQAQDGEPQISALNQRITSLAEETNVLQSQVEAATAEQRELTRARDNSWETYQLMLNRQVEEQVASQSTSTEVRIADRAITPTEPVGRGILRNVLVAAIIGFMGSSTFVLVSAWWAYYDDAENVELEDERATAVQPKEAQAGDARSSPHLSDTVSS